MEDIQEEGLHDGTVHRLCRGSCFLLLSDALFVASGAIFFPPPLSLTSLFSTPRWLSGNIKAWHCDSCTLVVTAGDSKTTSTNTYLAFTNHQALPHHFQMPLMAVIMIISYIYKALITSSSEAFRKQFPLFNEPCFTQKSRCHDSVSRLVAGRVPCNLEANLYPLGIYCGVFVRELCLTFGPLREKCELSHSRTCLSVPFKPVKPEHSLFDK